MDVYNISLFKQLVDLGMHREHATFLMEEVPELDEYNQAKDINYIVFFIRPGANNYVTIKDKSFDIEDINLAKEGGWTLGITINFKNLMGEVHEAIRSL